MAILSHDHGASDSLEEFRKFRERMNSEILAENNLVVNRFFALDTRTYEAGALDVRTKELLGLVASLVLRCDDCVTYHLVRCAEERITRAEIFESLSVGLIVGGSIVIPHMRRAVDRWSELEKAAD
jgi:AhpD family alkylhydroperoxidase